MRLQFAVSKLLILFIGVIYVQQIIAVNSDDIVGVWVTPKSADGNAHIEVTKENDKYLGKIVWLENPLYLKNNPDNGAEGTPLLDKRNPIIDKKSRPILGLSMLQGFTYKNNRWQGRTIYDPESGKTYKCKITLKRDGSLKVRGYIGVSILGRTSVWTKLFEPKNNDSKN